MFDSIDLLSIRSEAQNVKLCVDDERAICNKLYCGISEENGGIYRTDGLMEQEPITVF